MKKLMSTFFAVVVTVVSLVGSSSAQEAAYPDIVGKWASLSCEHRPPADQPSYLKREITFTEDGIISIIFHQFADPTCTQPTFTFRFDGSYEILGDSSVADGAKEANNTIDKVYITPNSADMVGFFNSAEAGTCGTETWAVDTEQFVTETGCSVLGLPVGLVTTEYEIYYVLNDMMFFGARPLDGSSLDAAEKRPTALLVPLLRVAE